MFEITIRGDTLSDMHDQLEELSFALGAGADRRTSPPKAKTPKPKADPISEPTTAEDRALQDELTEPVPPAPATAAQVVDAGTGKPITQTVKMSSDDVRVAAAKLAAKDAKRLAEILGSYDAAKLSEVPKDKLGAFASDVMEALG